MSAIEETLARINLMGGVEGYVIVDHRGTILRHSKSLKAGEAEDYAHALSQLTHKARHVVRDLDPKNDLEFFRLRGREVELLCAPSADFLVIVLQRWKPSGGSGGPGAGAGGGEAHADAAGGAAGGAAAPK